MKNLKLNKLNRISDELKNAVRGGDSEQPTCTCGCCYANQEGSSMVDNMIANHEHRLYVECDQVQAAVY